MVDGFAGLRDASVARAASPTEANECEELLVVQRRFALCQYTPLNLDTPDAGRWTLGAPCDLGNIDKLGKPIAFCNVLAAS